MSYEIIYQKQFIKAIRGTEKVFIPMVEAGSNNCYEAGGRNARRARSWWPLTYAIDGKLYATLDEMLAGTNRVRQQYIDNNAEYRKNNPDWDVYTDKGFGYFSGLAIGTANTSKCTFAMYQGIYKTGCAKAKTVEELAEAGIDTVVWMYYYDLDKVKEKGIEPFRITVKTSEELIKVIDEKTEYLKGTGYNVSIMLDGWDGAFKKLRKSTKEVKTKSEWVYVDEHWVLKSKNGYGYFVKNTRNGYRYNYSSSFCKRFATEKEANQFKKRMKNGEHWEAEHLKERAQVRMRVPIQKTAEVNN